VENQREMKFMGPWCFLRERTKHSSLDLASGSPIDKEGGHDVAIKFKIIKCMVQFLAL